MDRPAAIGKLALMLMEQESRTTEVARLLHDNAGPTLSAIGFHLQALRGDASATAEIQGYLEQAMENVREACNRLQSNVVERSGLPLALELLINRQKEASGIQVKLQISSKRRFSANIGFAAYRVVEMALDNVIRHAGDPFAGVQLTAGENGLVVTVQDKGCGFDTRETRLNPPGTGLILMESYAESANMQLRVDSMPGTGTIIRIQTI